MRVIGLLVLVGCSENAIQKVEDAPVDGQRILAVDPEVVDFGTLTGSGPVAQAVHVTSVGDLPVTVSTIDVAGSSAYTISWALAPTTLDPGESLDVLVTYAPQSIADSASMVVHNDSVDGAIAVPLLGAGTYPAIAVDPPSLSFQSDYGEPVTQTVTFTSVGTADLLLATSVFQGSWFSGDIALPVTLAPGESTTAEVTYTPDVAGESVAGSLWLSTNTAAGYALVPLAGHDGPVCVGLGEAWDRGLLSAQTDSTGLTFVLENVGADEDICMDRWYVFLSEGSQDLGAGDMENDVGGDYPNGTIVLGPGESVRFGAEVSHDAAWWCLEDTQYTAPNQAYEFLGARVFTPVLEDMTGQDQDAVWSWQDDHPLMLAARGTNYLEVPAAGGSGEVAIRVLNMGSQRGTADVVETIPVGFAAADFSETPAREDHNGDGSTSYTFSVTLDARVKTGLYEDSIYDEHTISYTLTTPSCSGRQYLTPMETRWTDSDGIARTDTANPLVVNCVE
jgi:hypothetical protein